MSAAPRPDARRPVTLTTLAEKRAQWLRYRSRADSVRSSPSTGAAVKAVATLDSLQRRHVDVDYLVLCTVSALECPQRSRATEFRAGQAVHFSFKQKDPVGGRTQAVSWKWIGPDGDVVAERRYDMAHNSRTRQQLSGSETRVPGAYALYFYDAEGHLIGRQPFRVK